MSANSKELKLLPIKFKAKIQNTCMQYCIVSEKLDSVRSRLGWTKLAQWGGFFVMVFLLLKGHTGPDVGVAFVFFIIGWAMKNDLNKVHMKLCEQEAEMRKDMKNIGVTIYQSMCGVKVLASMGLNVGAPQLNPLLDSSYE